MKEWIYPTIIFLIFAYVMVFSVIYTYKSNPSSSTAVLGERPKASISDFKDELLKKIN